MDFLDTHRPYRPDYNGKGLLTEEVSRPFYFDRLSMNVGSVEGIKSAKSRENEAGNEGEGKIFWEK